VTGLTGFGAHPSERKGTAPQKVRACPAFAPAENLVTLVTLVTGKKGGAGKALRTRLGASKVQ